MKKNFYYHPWVMLKRELSARKWKQTDLAKLIWISKCYVNDIVSWKKNFTPRLAFLIWKALWTWAEIWLNLQNSYDLWIIDNDKEMKKEAKMIEIRAKELQLA